MSGRRSGGAGKSTFFRLLAVRDEWFSDDLRKLDDDNVYRKLQGHWIIEMSEMMATANAKSIEEIKSFLSRQKEVYKIPYEIHPADRPRQCVFGGTSNALDFLPLDRSGNRRFIPIMVYPEQAEVHILEDEAASRAYISQMWAEAMEIYRSGRYKLSFSPAMQRYLKEHQRDFMPEDTKAGMIQAYLDKYTGETVCSKQLYKEALNHTFDEPKQWEIREINEIMNQCITGWRYFFESKNVFRNMADKRAGSVKTRQRTPATRLKKRWTVLWRSQNRWSFHSENDSPLPLVAIPLPSRLPGKTPYFRAFSPMTTKTTEK